MQVLENKEEWSGEFRNGWLKHLEETGESNWKIYPFPQNFETPAGPGIRLADSRLIFITSAGAYLRDAQAPFDAASPVGDYTIRSFPADTPLNELAYAHTHYDHAMIDADPQVALPLGHLQSLVDTGKVGELSASLVSVMGYQPDSARVVDETIPPILELVDREKPDAALLAPV